MKSNRKPHNGHVYHPSDSTGADSDIYMTDSFGHPVPDDRSSLKSSAGGHVLLGDTYLTDKLAHFNRERIPERTVFAKGVGAHGFFTSYQSMSDYTRAGFLDSPDKTTEIFVRFSNFTGARGSPDTVRDLRGFAVKFYTGEGIFDIVSVSLPVFFIRDALKFPDLVHSLKPSPDTNLVSRERFWDFVSLTPESTNMITWLYSDLGIIKDYRHMDGYGVNTFIWYNRSGGHFYVRYRLKSLQGIETVSPDEAEKLAVQSPDISSILFYDSIKRHEYPKYEFCVQIINPADTAADGFNPFDPSVLWPEENFPLQKVGVISLVGCPENYFAEVEQAAFSPGNIVPGIGLSPDCLLAGQAFSCPDAQRYRLGANYSSLPVNRPAFQTNTNRRDGSMTYVNPSSPVNYSPNSLNKNNPVPIKAYNDTEIKTGENILKNDDFRQAGMHYISMSEGEKERLCHNIAKELYTCRDDIKRRMISYFAKASDDFANCVISAAEKYMII